MDTCPFLETPSQDPRARRKDRRQHERRRHEERCRATIVRRSCVLHEAGIPWCEIADALDVPERTLRDWRQTRDGKTCCPVKRRGRVCLEVPAAKRSAVFQLLQLTGPLVGLPTLQAIFTFIPRAILEDLLTRYRRWWRKKHRVDGHRLTWLVPGRVWAIDFTEKAGQYLLTVRDLGSHYHLCWERVPSLAAEHVIPILRRLFAEHGSPLVLKSDNGSAFIADGTLRFLGQSGVLPLFSPPRKPKYNGALERSNTTMKSHTAASAEAAGHPLYWTSEDLQHAMRVANQLSRPWGNDGPTPEEAWLRRSEITDEERERLSAT